MSLLALRGSVAISRMDHVACVRVGGPNAFEAVDRLVPRELFVRDGQALHTLLLDGEAHPRADLYVMNDEDELVLLAEGIDGASLCDLVGDGARDLRPDHELVSVSGPYAWELLVDALTPDVVGLPYLGCFHHQDVLCLRAGKTGEYGYDLLVPASSAPALRRRLAAAGERFDAREADLATLDVAAVENGFFSARWPLPAGTTPLELQLQWRVSYRKTGYPGAEALRARRQAGVARRTTTLLATGPLTAGDEVACDGAPIGTLLAAARSPLREAWVGLALLDRAYACAGVNAYAVRGARVHTTSAPVLDNRSLFVDPQRHTYANRHEDAFPPVARRPPWDAS